MHPILAAIFALAFTISAFAQVALPNNPGALGRGYLPSGHYASLSVSTTSANVALPAGSVVIVYNTGAQAAILQFGGSTVAATTTAGEVIPANSAAGFAVGSNTYIAAITSANTTSLIISAGSGRPP